MPVFPPFFTGLAEVRCEQTMPSGAAAVSVFFVNNVDSDPLEDKEQGISDAFQAFYAEMAGESLSTAWTLDQIVIIDRSEENGQVFYHPMNIPGEEATAALPSQTQMCITWRTATGGRRGRGRTFMGGFTESSSTAAGDIEPATVTALKDAAEDLTALLTTGLTPLVILSRGKDTGPVGEQWVAFWSLVTSVAVNSKWDVLRSRRR